MNYTALMQAIASYPPQMSAAERSAAYSRGEEVDHIPFSLGLGESTGHLYGCTVRQYNETFAARKAELDFIRSHPELEQPLGGNIKMGLRGVGAALGSVTKSPENSIDYVERYVLTDYGQMPELEAGFDPASNAFLAAKLDMARAYRAEYGPDFPVTTAIAGPLSTAIAVRKPELVMRDMIKNKAKVHELLDMCVRCNLKWVQMMLDVCGKTAVSVADPASSMYLISERQFKEFCMPHLEDMLSGIEALTGKRPGMHICGKTRPIWPYLAELRLPSFSVDNCEDLSELKEVLGDSMLIIGNVPPVDVFCNGTPEEVIAAVIACIAKASDSPRGYNLSLGCQIPVGTPFENMLAYVYAARRYGRGAKMGRLCKGLADASAGPA